LRPSGTHRFEHLQFETIKRRIAAQWEAEAATAVAALAELPLKFEV
jgi:hypothetical protein